MTSSDTNENCGDQQIMRADDLSSFLQPRPQFSVNTRSAKIEPNNWKQRENELDEPQPTLADRGIFRSMNVMQQFAGCDGGQRFRLLAQRCNDVCQRETPTFGGYEHAGVNQEAHSFPSGNTMSDFAAASSLSHDAASPGASRGRSAQRRANSMLVNVLSGLSCATFTFPLVSTKE